MITSSYLTKGDLAHVLQGLQFAAAQMGLDMPSAIGDAYRAGFAAALAAVAVSFGVAGDVRQAAVTVVTVPERYRLGA